MSDKKVSKFIKWAKNESYRRGLICHFYIPDSEKQYYDKTDFAYFNLFSDSRYWIIKGTPNHGIRSKKGKCSPVFCLNCFQVNDEFFSALKTLEERKNHKFDLGILFYKRKLKNRFKVIDVSIERPALHPPPSKCHYYDNASSRKGVLYPFNYCDVVRIEVPGSEFRRLPIAAIPRKYIAGFIVRRGDYWGVTRLLKKKGMSSADAFPFI